MNWTLILFEIAVILLNSSIFSIYVINFAKILIVDRLGLSTFAP